MNVYSVIWYIIVKYSALSHYFSLMAVNPRYKTANKLISEGSISTIGELMDIIPKTPLAAEIKTSPQRLNKLLSNPELFLFQDAYNIAALIGVDEKMIVDLIHNQYMADKKGRRKK